MEKKRFTKEESLALKAVAVLLLIMHHTLRFPFLYDGYTLNFFPLVENQVNYISEYSKICVGIFAFYNGVWHYRKIPRFWKIRFLSSCRPVLECDEILLAHFHSGPFGHCVYQWAALFCLPSGLPSAKHSLCPVGWVGACPVDGDTYAYRQLVVSQCNGGIFVFRAYFSGSSQTTGLGGFGVLVGCPSASAEHGIPRGYPPCFLSYAHIFGSPLRRV